jgi:hypothetical protein
VRRCFGEGLYFEMASGANPTLPSPGASSCRPELAIRGSIVGFAPD